MDRSSWTSGLQATWPSLSEELTCDSYSNAIGQGVDKVTSPTEYIVMIRMMAAIYYEILLVLRGLCDAGYVKLMGL